MKVGIGLGGKTYPGSLHCETSSKAQPFQTCFPLLKPPTPPSAESTGEKREHVDMQSPRSTMHASPPPTPGSTAPTCSLQPLDIFRLPDNLPALKPQLPAQENVGEKNIYQNNYTTPWLSSLVSGSCLFCLYFHPALGPDFCMLFWVFLSIRKHKWIFLFSIGSYYPYCPATCCFLKWLDYQDWLHMKIA